MSTGRIFRARIVRDPMLDIEFSYEFAADALEDALGALREMEGGDAIQLARLHSRIQSIGFILGDGLTRCEALLKEAMNERLSI